MEVMVIYKKRWFELGDLYVLYPNKADHALSQNAMEWKWME